MLLLRNVLAAVTIIGAYTAVAGAAMIRPTVMGVAGIVAALAAIGWGLLSWLAASAALDAQIDEALGDHADDPADEEELPYVPVDRGRAPVWDTDIVGAPE